MAEEDFGPGTGVIPDIGPEEHKFVQKLAEEELANSAQSIKFVSVLPLNTTTGVKKSRTALDSSRASELGDKWKESLVIVTNLRIMIAAKRALWGHGIKNSFAILKVVSIFCDGSVTKDKFIISFEFKQSSDSPSDLLDVICSQQQAKDMFLSVYCQFELFHNEIPNGKIPIEVDVPKRFMKRAEMSKLARGKNNLDAILQLYYAHCDLEKIVPNAVIETYIRDCIEREDKVLNLAYAVGFVSNVKVPKHEKLTPQDFYCLMMAIEYNKFFESIIGKEVPLGDLFLHHLKIPIARNMGLKSLHLEDVEMTRSSAKSIGQGFSELRVRPCQSYLNQIIVSEADLGNTGTIAIIDGINKGNMSAHTLDFAYTGLKSEAMAKLEHCLVQTRFLMGLKNLALSGNEIGKSGAQCLSNFIKQCSDLETLRLRNCGLGSKSVVLLIETVKKNSELDFRMLDISFNKVDKESVRCIASFMESTKTLRQLYLAGTSFPKSCLEDFWKAIIKNKNGMKFSIDISCNELGSMAVESLQTAIDSIRPVPAPMFERLNFGFNTIGVEGLESINELLSKLPCLVGLDISGCIARGIFTKTDSVSNLLCQLLDSRSTVKELVINGDEGRNLGPLIGPVFQSLALNRSLIRFSAKNNRITQKDFETLVKSMASNGTIRFIDVDENHSNAKTLKLLLEGAMKSESLFSFDLFYDIERITSTTQRNECLELSKSLDTQLDRNRKTAGEEKYKLLLKYCSQFEQEKESEFEVSARSRRMTRIRSVQLSLDELPCCKATKSMMNEFPTWTDRQFAIELDQVSTTRVEGYVAEIPTVLVFALRWLLKHEAYNLEGIFRLAPESQAFAVVKEELDDGTFEDCEDPHAMANCVKVWFRDLPTKLLASVDLGKVSPSIDESSAMSLVKSLPEPQQSILLWLSDLCIYFAKFESKNRMNVANLAIVLTPNLYDFSQSDAVASIHQMKTMQALFESLIAYRISHKEFETPTAEDEKKRMEPFDEKDDEPASYRESDKVGRVSSHSSSESSKKGKYGGMGILLPGIGGSITPRSLSRTTSGGTDASIDVTK
jgi:hypothetical protein